MSAKATREFTIRNIITGHCGAVLTPTLVDQIVSEVVTEMAVGTTSWAFRGEPEPKPLPK